MGVRWDVASPLSTRYVEERMQERGVTVEHATMNRETITYGPLLEEALHRRTRPVRVSWRMDETDIKGKGPWRLGLGRSIRTARLWTCCSPRSGIKRPPGGC